MPPPDNRYAELERDILDDEPPLPARAKRRAHRLLHLPTHFVRVPVPWLTKPRREMFSPQQRLFLYLLYRSHWGQKGVRLTNTLAAEVGISRRTKSKILERLASDGWVRIEQSGRGRAPTVWPIVIIG